MQFLLDILENLYEAKAAAQAAGEGNMPIEISGVSHIHKAHIACTLGRMLKRRSVIICPDELTAKRTAGDIGSLTAGDVCLLPAREFALSGIAASSHEWEHRRISALHSFINGKSDFLVCSVEAALQRCIPPDILKEASFSIRIGDSMAIEEISARLISAGYRRSGATEGAGQFSVRGGIIDIFPPSYENPVRIELFGDEIDTISFFDSSTQRRTEKTAQVWLEPAREVLCQFAVGEAEGLCSELRKASEKAAEKELMELSALLSREAELISETGEGSSMDALIPFIYKESCLLDYIDDALVFFDDMPRLREAASAFSWRMDEDVKALISEQRLNGDNARFYVDYDRFISGINPKNAVIMNTFSARKSALSPKKLVQITAKQLPSYNGSIESAVSDIKYYCENGYSVCVLCSGEQRCNNMMRILTDGGVRAVYVPQADKAAPAGTALVTVGALSAGFEYHTIKLAVITEGQITVGGRSRQRAKKFEARERVKSYSDLKPGDIIVHEAHGIGRFVGMEKLSVDGADRDYIRLAFQGTDTLFIPATALGVISKYIGSGGEESNVRLSKLGGTDWQKKKAYAKAAAHDMAKKLIQLYAERQRRPGFAFAKDDQDQAAFEEAFDYQETEDQLRCISEIKRDMERPVPMDRLLCGDVGFGKTEVAMRAIMKCALSGKQAALLVPTTVLARQHYLTAVSRFKGTAMKIEMLSRFRTAAEEKRILAGIKSGRIDLIIGTHKLLKKDVRFRDLGLLVVDEEQRFGVSHKETIKEMAKNVDVLTLSATPIPRTLSMALSGIRDMSLIEQAPSGRQPVTTYVMEYDSRIINDAIGRELSRGGQVYYLHNRTESIDHAAMRISAAFPDAIVETAHGRMSEEQLSDIMQKLSDGEIQILVCTTIIETGIDVPNVNTLIIENAENFGLSQLHQIRGRVGRSQRRAYAYFTYRAGKVLTEISQKRLSAIREFAEFGSGFKIAMRDLEIRGAGNVLGAEQSGHMTSVGYDMYLKLLEEAVLTEQGKKPQKSAGDCNIDLHISANIDDGYVPHSGERIDLYRRIALIRNDDDYSDMLDELIDRYGDIPQNTLALVEISRLRAEAARAGISEISQKENSLIIKFFEFDFAMVSSVCALPEYKGRLLLSAGKSPYISLRLKKSDDVLRTSAAIVKAFAGRSTAALTEA